MKEWKTQREYDGTDSYTLVFSHHLEQPKTIATTQCAMVIAMIVKNVRRSENETNRCRRRNKED